MPPEHGQEIAFGIPQADGFIIAGGEDLLAIRAKFYTSEKIFILPPKYGQEIAFGIPQADGSILTGGKNLATIGAKCRS